MIRFIKIFLLPFSFIYGFIVFFRNKFFDWHIFPVRSFDIPIVVVGNLTVGGTGKTPHSEYLIRLLKDKYQIAVLSRGYKRQTKKFQLVEPYHTYKHVGDEPLQIKRKFPQVPVAVDKNRVHGINQLRKKFPKLDLIILDDAFQHRYVKPGLSILLTDYHQPYWDNMLLPYGTLRESVYQVNRADMIIVTKTPNDLSPIEQRIVKEEIKPLPYQNVYISYIKYGNIIRLKNKKDTKDLQYYFKNNYNFLLFAGIANTKPLEELFIDNKAKYQIVKFPDHHNYTKTNLFQIKRQFNLIESDKKILITTEKDAMRLIDDEPLNSILDNIPTYYLPIEIAFHDQKEYQFNKQILEYVRKNKIFN